MRNLPFSVQRITRCSQQPLPVQPTCDHGVNTPHDPRNGKTAVRRRRQAMSPRSRSPGRQGYLVSSPPAPPIRSCIRGVRHTRTGARAGPESEKRGIVMRKVREAVVRFIEREDGPTAVEYAVMLALIVVVCLGAITTLGQNANAVFSN